MTNIHCIEKRKCSCFCSACIDQTESIDECENQIKKFVQPWKLEQLTPLPPFGNVSDKEMDNEVVVIDNDYDRVSDMVREGDVFAVIAPENNQEKVHYYLLRCTMSKSTLLQEYNDPSNYTYPIGSMVLMGHFFEEVKKCKDHIIFQDYQPEVIYAQYSHLVIATRLQLKQVKSRKKQRQWRLSIDDHDAILENLPLAHFI